MSYLRTRRTFHGEIGSLAVGQFRYCLCSFLRKGIKDRDNSIPSSNSGGGERSHEREADTHVTRRCLVPRIHGIHCVTKLPLHEQEIRCARRAKKLGCIPRYRSTRIHLLLSMNRFSHDLYLWSIFIYYLLSLFSQINGYKICKTAVTKKRYWYKSRDQNSNIESN